MKSRSTRDSTGDEAGRIPRILLFALVLVPTIVCRGFFFPYTTIRSVYFRVLIELAMAFLMYLVVRREVTSNFRRDYLFWALVAWVAANTLAAAFGVAPIRSIFGDHERMGGVWFWLHLLAYYVLLRTFMRPDDWTRMFQLAVAVAFLITLYGLVQYWFAPFRIGIGGVEAGVTIGNNGLLASYLLANIALCALLAARTGVAARLGYTLIAFLMVVAIVFTGNRSSTLGIFIGGAAAVVAYAAWSRSLRGRRAVVLGILLASAAALPFVVRLPWAAPVTMRIPALGRLSSGVDSSRVLQWRAAVDGIRERPLLGVGPENYQVIWSRFHYPEMYRFVEDMRWDRAHNAYLEAFATAGITGFLSLLAIFLALGWSATSASRQSLERTAAGPEPRRRPAVEAAAFGFFVAYAFYLFFWFFDLNSAMLLIALGAYISSRAVARPLVEIGAPRPVRSQSTVVLSAGALALVSVLYVHGYATLRMARALDVVQTPGRPFDLALGDFESVFSSPAPVTQHALPMFTSYLRASYAEFPKIRADAARAALFDRAFALAVKEFERQVVQDPTNERVLVQNARVLMLGAYYYNNPKLYESAIAKLEQAIELAPRRVAPRLVLGLAYLNARRPDQALSVFGKAHAIYPPLGQTHAYISEAYFQLGAYGQAAGWLQTAIRQGKEIDYPRVQHVVDSAIAAGEFRRAADLSWEYLRRKAGPAFLWRTSAGTAAETMGIAMTTSELLRWAGDTVRVEVILAAVPSLCLQLVPLAELADVRIPSPRPLQREECLSQRDSTGYVPIGEPLPDKP